MRRKYISTQIQLAARSERPIRAKDIHVQLQETIAERKNILPDWEKLFLDNNSDAASIHFQLKNTIAKLKRTRLLYKEFLASTSNDIYALADKKAA